MILSIIALAALLEARLAGASSRSLGAFRSGR
jgi:hypothetical protein